MSTLLHRWLPLFAVFTATNSCSNAASIPDFGSPDLEQILVFYPVGGLVRGRGLSGSAPLSATHIVIKAHPNGSETIRPVDENRGFEFTILARGGDVLEVSGATDARGTERGEPAFVRVPTGTFSNRDYICCFDTGNTTRGTCQTTDERDEQLQRTDGIIECPSAQSGRTRCTFDEDCGFEEGEWLGVDLDRLQVTTPDRSGFISVSGFVEPRSLVTLQNRGLSGIGQPQEQLVVGRISSDIGDFEFPSVRARGDDELVLQVQDLNGIRSPSVSIRVGDADVEGIDVTGVFAWRPLRDDDIGTVAILMAPYGIDGLGMCPDHGGTPQTCFSGGLTHDMVTIENLRVDGQGEAEGVTWAPTPLSPDFPDNRGYDGNVRAGPLDVVLVIDRSEAAGNGILLRNTDATRAVTDFVSGLRARDRVGAVEFGARGVSRLGVVYDMSGRPQSTGLFTGAEGRSTLITSIQNALGQDGGGGATVFEAIEEAAEMLRNSSNSGRIVVITTQEQLGSIEESALAFDEAFEKIEASNSVGSADTRVDIIGVSLTRTEKFEDIQAITAFTGGEYFDVATVLESNVNRLSLALSDIRSTLSGSFLLLYDIQIPPGVGKAARIEFDARMNGVQSAVQYSGLLRIDLAAN